MGREEFEHLGETAGGEAVVAADARALLEMDRRVETMGGENFIRDLERFLEADRSAQATPADLEEDLVRDIVVRGSEQLDEDLRKRTRLPMHVDWR